MRKANGKESTPAPSAAFVIVNTAVQYPAAHSSEAGAVAADGEAVEASAASEGWMGVAMALLPSLLSSVVVSGDIPAADDIAEHRDGLGSGRIDMWTAEARSAG